MKHFVARFKRRMLNKEARKDAEKVLEVSRVGRGWNIADVGTGGGHYVSLFAELVGQDGRVYAVDTDEKLLKYIEKDSAEKKLTQVQCVHTEEGVPELPAQSLDMAFFRDVYHHLQMDRVEYFKNFKKLLKPDGKIVIIDYLPGGYHRIFGHASHPDEIKRELSEAGYTLIKEYDFLPKQSFQIYK